MIDVSNFISCLTDLGVDFFTGVPDSLLKSFCAYVTDHCPDHHVIAANEGGAVGLAAGHYLATGRPALVYMQNSGQGNAVNPLRSLAEADFKRHGVNVVIYANQLTRIGFPAMQAAARTILEHHRAKECDASCMPIKEIINLIPEE